MSGQTRAKVAAVVQARTGSTRLPGKVLLPLPRGGETTVLAQVLRRLGRATRLDEVVVATTTAPADDAVVRIAEAEGAAWFRGSEADVLARYCGAATARKIDVVVRVTSDCPCIDPAVTDLVVARHLDSGADYTSNSLCRSWPHGLDVEVFGAAALARAGAEATAPEEREHVTPYLYRSGAFRVQSVEAPDEERGPEIRVTLDTPQDYTLLCAVYDLLADRAPLFFARDLVDLFRRRPWLREINREVIQRRVCATLAEEIEETLSLLKLQGLGRAEAVVRSLVLPPP